MRVSRIQLKNFRNYDHAELTPCEGVTVLFGDNAQGKTNALEALMLCCIGRSHRTARDQELIGWGQQHASVDVTVERRDGARDVRVALKSTERKKVTINGNALSRSGELMGHLTGVMFAPEDLRMVKDGPAERRRFIDSELSQMRPSYYYALQRYNRALKQRNTLLRELVCRPVLEGTLTDWNRQLATHGADIMMQRTSFVSLLSKEAAQNHLEISDGRENLSVIYQPNHHVDAGETPSAETLFRALEASTQADIRRGTTTIGPHRDDLQLLLEGKDARVYGSQGQQRTVALSLKLSELAVMHTLTGEWPVLMLDDVMSELDPSRRRQLLRRLQGVQTLVTCTDPADLAGAEIGAAYRVSAGQVEAIDVNSIAWRRML